MISVIIPTRNEAERMDALLSAIHNESTPHEVIVADGGSVDQTAEISTKYGARVVMTEPGRGQQLYAGADHAVGDVLLFLHADSCFPVGALGAIREVLASPDVVGGNFHLQFDGETPFSKWLNRFYAWIRSHGLYYGDSGVFVRRQVYETLGGIRPIALMEDYDFVRRMERSGETVCIEEPSLVTSSRKFEGRSGIAIVGGWLLLHGLYHLGVSPDLLAKIYYGPGFTEWREHNA